MSDSIDIKVTGSKGTPIVLQKTGPLEVNVSASKQESMNVSKNDLKLQILSSVAGAKGDSLYDIAKRNGYEGTEAEFIQEYMSQGGGFYNLDNEHPLEGGNYTLESAVETISSDTKISDKRKNGMIITFWDGSEWKIYAYSLFYDGSPSAVSEFANIDNWKEFESGGGGSESGRIILQRESPNMTTKVGSPVSVSFYYDHVLGEGEEQQSTGNSGQAKIIISRAGYQQVINMVLPAGSHTEVDLTKYMAIGVTSVRLQVSVDTGLVIQSAALAWTISEVLLNVTSDSLTGYTVVEKGQSLEISYTLESGSADTKSVICYLDGVQCAQQTIATSVGSGAFTINTTNLNQGQHTIQLRAQQATGEIDENEQPVLIYSNLIYTIIGVYTPSTAATLLTMKVNIENADYIFGINDTLVLNLNQYDTLTFGYGARDKDNISTEITVKDGEDIVAAVTNYRQESTFVARILTDGTHTYTINAGENAQITFTVDVAYVDLGIEVPSGRKMYLDATENGHHNTDNDRDTWENTEGEVLTTTTMTGFTWSGDGWINGAFRLTGSARATINYKPLNRTQSGGAVIGFKYRCLDVEEGHEQDVVISCMDDNDTGFYITPTEIGMKQNGAVRTSMKTAIGNIYDIAFVVWPPTGSSSDGRKNARFVYLYIDGIISGGYRLAEGTSVFQDNSVNISVGASYVTTDIFRTWAFDRALNDSEMLDTYILDQDDNISLLLEKRDSNKILDNVGNVTPESLPDGTRIMIITGQATPTGGSQMASVLAAAAENNKSKYFPCTEISSYIKGASDRSKNFVARNNGSDISGGLDMSLKLRLQGTSSLAYPVKNYRIYTKKSTMYVGNNPEMPFGETGTIAQGGKFAMHDTSAPVAVWCLKADYAESSSTHNTGMARMVNDTLKACNILTPPQRDVDTESYPYDVRTTVDGEPCILFYRETLTDTPIFLGKFNFNNDKSTEAVFGFTGINGYHDESPLNDIDNQETEFVAQQYKTATGKDLGVDLTECWEFKNNEDPMGSFLDDDFEATVTDPDSGEETPRWLGTFEARYPDEDDLNDKFADVADPIVPHYLSTLVSWVKSTRVLDTDTEEQAEAKLQKFRDELSQYFNVEHLCAYFVFTQIMACLDQMVKNMMMGFWYDKNADGSSPMGKVRAYMIFYDNDTILGLINNGRLLAPYDVDRDMVQLYDAGGNPVYYYAGHESVLWNNLAEQFPNEIHNAYVKIREFLTNAKLFEYFDRDQASKFCERIYNLDALNKYVAPTNMEESSVAPYRDLMQGSRESHRQYFVKNRLSLYDNMWRGGEYYSSANEVSFKGISAAGSAVTYTIRRDGNVEVKSDVSDDFVRNYPSQGNVSYTIGKLTSSAVGTIFHIYGMRQLTKLNVAEWDFDQLNLGDFQYLEEFIFGSLIKTDGVTANPFTKPYYTSGLVIGNSMPKLKKFIAQNCVSLPSADISGCNVVEEIDLCNSKSMMSVNIPIGAPLTKYKLPTCGVADVSDYSLFNLSLIGLPNLSEWDIEGETGLNIGAPAKIQTLTFRDCPNIDGWGLLKDVASAVGTSLNTVNVTLGSIASGSVTEIQTLLNLWNNVSGEGSNLHVFGTFVITQLVTRAKLAEIGFVVDDTNYQESQLSSKIYGLTIRCPFDMISVLDEHTVVQCVDPNSQGYNPAMSIKLADAGYGTWVDDNDHSKGWYLQDEDAALITAIPSFKNITGVVDTNGICGTAGTTYYLEEFDEFEYFTGVTSIPTESFLNCTTITSIKIPYGVTSIGGGAFSGCTSLSSATLSNSITSIGPWAFYRCAFTSLTIPDSVTVIDINAFQECTSLTEATLNGGQTATPTGNQGRGLFVGCTSLQRINLNCVMRVPNDGARTPFQDIGSPSLQVVIGEGTGIAAYTFGNCKSLTSVSFPSTLTSIGYRTFTGCSSLTSITIPNSVTSIGDEALARTGLTSLTVPSSVNVLGNLAFQNCTSLTEVTLNGGQTATPTGNQGNSIFSGCTSLQRINLNCVTRVSNQIYAPFQGIGSPSLQVVINDDVTVISGYLFRNCTNLTSVTIPSTLTTIGALSFYNCSSLTSVSFPSTLTSIGVQAFYGCSLLTSITIPDNVTVINNGAFANCTSLTEATVGRSVTDSGLYINTGLEIFKGCTSLETIYFNAENFDNNVYTGQSKFSGIGSQNLTIVIGSNVTILKANAFAYCAALSTIIANPDTPPSVVSSTFSGTNITAIYVHAESVAAYQSASGWSAYASIITAIPSN